MILPHHATIDNKLAAASFCDILISLPVHKYNTFSQTNVDSNYSALPSLICSSTHVHKLQWVISLPSCLQSLRRDQRPPQFVLGVISKPISN